jgi:predicted HTH domain antitoxin
MIVSRQMGRPAKRSQTLSLQEFIPMLREARKRYGKLTDVDKQLLHILSGGDRSVEKELFRSYKPNTPRNLIFDMEFAGRTSKSPEALKREYEDHHLKVSLNRKISQRNRRNQERENTDVILLKIAKILSMLKPAGHLSVSRAATLAKKQLEPLGIGPRLPSERTLRRIINAYQSTKLATQRHEKSN